MIDIPQFDELNTYLVTNNTRTKNLSQTRSIGPDIKDANYNTVLVKQRSTPITASLSGNIVRRVHELRTLIVFFGRPGQTLF